MSFVCCACILQIIEEAFTVASHHITVRFSTQVGLLFFSAPVHFISDSLHIHSPPR